MLSAKRLYRAALYTLVGILPFNTLITVWLATNVGHLYVWSAWPDILVGLIACYALVRLARDKKLQVFVQRDWLTWLVIAYVALHIAYIVFSHEQFLAIIGSVFNTRFLILFACVRLLTFEQPARVQRWIIYASIAVVGLALLQTFVLPADFLTHFGYDKLGVNTSGIPPAYHTVGSSGLIRAQATLRGPNVLGAYLLLPLAIVGSIFLTTKNQNKKMFTGGLVLLFALGIFLSFSRSAWLGAAAAIGLAVILSRVISKKTWLVGMVVALILVVPLGLIVRRSPVYSSLVLHESSKSAQNNSTPQHFRALKAGAEDIAQHPFGHGVGTAGPVSALSHHPVIAENYFIQVGQELGLLGLLIFLLVHGLVAWQLWQRRGSQMAQIALAAFVGLVVTNLMLHTWADDAVALTFWLYAGVVLQPVILNKKRKHNEEKPKTRS